MFGTMRLARSLAMMALAVLFSFLVMHGSAQAYTGKILFDQGHGETAGNADWTINGAYSELADALRSDGYTVASTASSLTDTLLSQYDVLVLPEPNINFSSSEKSAIIRFIQNGGGVYFIAEHNNSDRNNDGVDSVDIYNSFVNTLGFTFNYASLSKDPITDIRNSPVTSGVSAVGCWGGTTIKVGTSNSSIVKDIYLNADPFHIHGSYGNGRFAALGDSSLYDDGTGNPGDSLHPNWYDYDDSILAVNTIEWLAGDR